MKERGTPYTMSEARLALQTIPMDAYLRDLFEFVLDEMATSLAQASNIQQELEADRDRLRSGFPVGSPGLRQVQCEDCGGKEASLGACARCGGVGWYCTTEGLRSDEWLEGAVQDITVRKDCPHGWDYIGICTDGCVLDILRRHRDANGRH